MSAAAKKGVKPASLEQERRFIRKSMLAAFDASDLPMAARILYAWDTRDERTGFPVPSDSSILRWLSGRRGVQ